jgi:hypothetical protein
LLNADFEDQLPRIINKTLNLWGGRDNFINCTWWKKLNRILSDSTFLEIPGEFHNISISDPYTLAKIITAFELTGNVLI